MKRASFSLILIFASAVFAAAQTGNKKLPPASNPAAKSSPAYAEVLLRKTEIEAQLEEFSADYTDEFPKVKELKFELDAIQKHLNKILAVNASEAGKLTAALGKLIVRKTEIETDLWNLRNKFSDEHPEVKRARRKLEVFERAIKEILP